MKISPAISVLTLARLLDFIGNRRIVRLPVIAAEWTR
jgi:hypothetical protein